MTKKKKLIIAGAIIGGIILTLLLGLVIHALFFRCETCGHSEIFGDDGIITCPAGCIAGSIRPNCSRCNGTGRVSGYTCPKCYGLKVDYSTWVKCPTCHGMASIDCPDC